MTKSGWWGVNWDLTLDGEPVQWGDLDECSQERILEAIKEGFNGGEICIETDDDENNEDEEEGDT